MKHPDRASPLAALLYPLRVSTLTTIAFFGVMLTVASLAKLFGIFLMFVILVALAQYLFAIIRSSAMGNLEPPLLEPEAFNPWAAPAFGQMLLLTLVIIGGWVGMFVYVGEGAATVYLAATSFLLPAALAQLILNGRFLLAISPVHLVATAASIGPVYLVVAFLFFGIHALALLLIPLGLPVLVTNILSLYFPVLAAHVLGRMLYGVRDRIGIEAVNQQTLRDTAQQREEDRHRGDVFGLAFQESRTNSARALATLAEFIGPDASLADRQEAFHRTREWPQKNVAVSIAGPLVAAQMREGLEAQALDNAAWVARQGCSLQLPDASSSVAFARLAMKHQRYETITAALGDVLERFPHSPEALPAALFCGQVALRKTRQTALAGKLVEQMAATGKVSRHPKFLALKELLSTG